MSTELPVNLTPYGAAISREQPEGGTQPDDARRIPRRPYSGLVACGELGFSELAALDISPRGIGLMSTTRLELGQPVTLYFLDRTKKVRGVVRRVRTVFSCDWQVGVEFLDEQPTLIQAIESVS